MFSVQATTTPPELYAQLAAEFATLGREINRVLDSHERGIAALEHKVEDLERDSHKPVSIPIGEMEARLAALERQIRELNPPHDPRRHQPHQSGAACEVQRTPDGQPGMNFPTGRVQ